jgi:acyl-coenzyme A synthetase/AMP-(fatty) acid ligase
VKFNPADVETLLDAHPQIQQSAIVPMPERLVVIPEMPLTPTRKIMKGRLRLPEQA